MQLKTWNEIAIPHSDVLKGTFLDAEFAADLSRVREALQVLNIPIQPNSLSVPLSLRGCVY